MNKRLLLASVAGLLAMGLAASPAFAQRGGGGGRGYGGGGGGRSYGGGGYGGGYGNYGRGYGGYGNYGGYGSYGRGYGGYGNNYYGGYGRGYGIGIGLGYSLPYYGGTYSNGYYGTPNSYAYGTYVDQQPIVGVNPGLSNYQVQMNSEPTGNAVAMQSYYSGPSSSSGSSQLTVKVPADAKLWLGPVESSQEGTERQFGFPSLPAGDNLFTLKATWNENGQTVTRERQVNVKGGENATVDLTKSASESTKPSNPNVGHPSDTNTSGQKITPPAKPNTGTDQ